LKIRRGNSSFIKIGQEYGVLYMKASIHVWSYLAQFFSEWDKFAEETISNILCSLTFFLENRTLYEITWKIL
jgi:hypothetical protein